jgi:DNA replication protein DnaC
MCVTSNELEKKPVLPHGQWETTEVRWATDPKSVQWTAELHDAVIFGDTPCPLCNGKQVLDVVQRFSTTGESRTSDSQCRCQSQIRFKADRYIKRILPGRYQRSNLWTLQPSSASKMSLQRQAKMLEFLRENPDCGYFFYGAPGTSKTTFATALVRRAIDRDWKDKIVSPTMGVLMYKTTFWIHYVNWDSYIQSLLDYQNHPDSAPEPVLTPRLIRQNAERGRTSCIVIEEIDKSRLTEYKANKLFDLVCAIDETKSQLVITTNHKTEESFQSWLYRTDNESVNLAGEPVWRRIVDNCKVVECKAE